MSYDTLDEAFDSLEASLDGDLERAGAAFGVLPGNGHASDIGAFASDPIVTPVDAAAKSKLDHAWTYTASEWGLNGGLWVAREGEDISNAFLTLYGVDYWPDMDKSQKKLFLDKAIGGAIFLQEFDSLLQLQAAWEDSQITWPRMQQIWEAYKDDMKTAAKTLFTDLGLSSEQDLNSLAFFLWVVHSVSERFGSYGATDPYDALIAIIDSMFAARELEKVVTHVIMDSQVDTYDPGVYDPGVIVYEPGGIVAPVQPSMHPEGVSVRLSDFLLSLGFALSVGMGVGSR